jgi:hypothetical protein
VFAALDGIRRAYLGRAADRSAISHGAQSGDCRVIPANSKRFLLPGKGGMRQDDRHVEKIDRHVLEIKSGSNI